MKIYAVVGTAPAHMGPCIVEAKVPTVLHSFVAMKGDKPVSLSELTYTMQKKLLEKSE